MIDFDNKRVGMHAISHPDVTDEIIEHASDHTVSSKVVCYLDGFYLSTDTGHDDINAASCSFDSSLAYKRQNGS